jgi:hypothetical protein
MTERKRRRIGRHHTLLLFASMVIVITHQQGTTLARVIRTLTPFASFACETGTQFVDIEQDRLDQRKMNDTRVETTTTTTTTTTYFERVKVRSE